MTSDLVIKAMTLAAEKELAMKDEMKLFIPITKVDEEKRLVFGKVTEETPDSSGEIFDYESSKPYFQEWTGYFQKATDGKSCGNLRAMHDAKKAVGYLPEVLLSDTNKCVEVVAKVVDDDEWKKTLEGVYTGFSQGGRYVRKWYDGKAYRYTASPNEISLVDYPALKSSTFQVVKSDGIVEEKPFKKVADRPTPKKETKKMDHKGELKKWVGSETYDARSALECLDVIYLLYAYEVADENAEQLADLKTVIERLKRFIASEIQEVTLEQGQPTGDLKKIGAKHSKETLGKIQTIHDHSVDMGAKCNKEASEQEGEMEKLDEALQKIDSLGADLKKVHDENEALKKENEEAKKKIEELGKQAEAAKGVVKDVVTITKADDTKAEGGGVKKSDETKDPLSSVKEAHQSPVAYRFQRPLGREAKTF